PVTLSMNVVSAAGAPVVTPPANQTANEGTSKTFQLGSFTASSSAKPWTVTVDWGDTGTTTFSTSTAGTISGKAHTYGDNGAYSAKVTVTDNLNRSANSTFTINVANAPPVVGAISANDEALVGKPFNATATFTDKGFLDTHTAVWNWGDNNTTQGTVTESN